MKSVTTLKFRDCFKDLPDHIQRTARKTYKLWKENPRHPSLKFKQVVSKELIYSVRVNIDYRALGVQDDDTIIWFWIGSHAEYDEVLKSL